MRTTVVIFTILLVGTAGSARGVDALRLDPPVSCPGTDDLLQYDDGLSVWITWGGLYRGVLFDLADFYDPVPDGFSLDRVEFWFYHSSYYPWDTSDFYGEVWTSVGSEPGSLEEISVLQASHYSAVDWYVAPPCTLGQQFWVLLNTGMSSGGWPALMGDNTPNDTGTSHSFFSDDFFVWQPWLIGGAVACDYFIRVEGEPVDYQALESSTWGLVKSTVR